MINPIHTYTPASQSSSSGKTADNKEQAQMFKNILDKAAGNRSESAQSITSSSSLGEVSSPMAITIQEPSGALQTHTEELIAKLEIYSNQLENPKVSLKEMGGLLKDIYTDAQDLLHKTKEMEGENGGASDLMDIARHSAITAQSEYIKFQRGDYI